MKRVRSFLAAGLLAGLMVSCGYNNSRPGGTNNGTGTGTDTTDTTGMNQGGRLNGSEDPRSQGVQGNQQYDSTGSKGRQPDTTRKN